MPEAEWEHRKGDPGHRAARFWLWVRWSWRDLRARWLQVLAISVIIAIGTGVYAGLSSNTVWRRANYDASFEALDSHDLNVVTAEGTFAGEGELVEAIEAMEHPEWVAAAEEKLVLPTQVDASEAAGKTTLVPGRFVGVDVRDDGPHVDGFEVVAGRGLEEGDDGEPVALLDSHFAEYHGLPDQGRIETSAGAVEYVGTGYTPEYFMVSSGTISFLAEAGFAVLFVPLGTAQQMLGAEGQVNQLAVALEEGVDPEEAKEELEAAIASAAPDLAVQVDRLEDERLHQRMYDDIESDQKTFNVFAFLILGGAAFASFNLVGRIVEAQRREIGVGMALGVQRAKLAVRPMLVAFQISLLGVLAGVGFGLWVGVLISDLNVAFLPLPVWEDPFQAGIFLKGVALGLGLTFAATIIPVWRAVRVDPVEAIHTRPSLTKSGLVPALHKVPLPGNSVHQFPFRNVVRAPRRTLLTVCGIAAAIAVMVALVGMVDSFLATIDAGEAEMLGHTPERATVTLDFFYPEEDERVTSLADLGSVGSAEPQLSIGGALIPDEGEEIETFITLIDFDSEQWAPTAVDGSLETEDPAVVLSRKAAEDLGVGPGDTVTLRHPLREGLGYSFVESELPVAAIHPNPYRFFLYMDRDTSAGVMALEGIVNTVSVLPADGHTADDVKRELFGRPGVAAVEGVNEVASTIRDTFEDLLGFLALIEGFVLLMAMLIAFNSTSISSDERRREHATMFAFGLPTRTVMGLTVLESVIIGVMATLLGIGVGRGIIAWMVRVTLAETMPDIRIAIDVTAGTYLTAAALGIVAVAVAPLLTLRRMRRMDIPSTLRVVE